MKIFLIWTWAAMWCASAAAADATAGRAAFQACAACHAVYPGARGGFGPTLYGIVGRTAGTTPGYAYSPAMKNAGIVWTDATLAAFIKDPGGTVPGTRMRFYALGYDERRIADLLAYLHTLAPPR